jgi:flagellar basal-body rod protein FlgC
MRSAKLLLVFLGLLFNSCATKGRVTLSQIDTFCQDLNVLYIKIGVYTSNLVNIDTTRVSSGGPYKRKIVKNCRGGFCQVVVDQSPPIIKYEADHVDANENGYVAYPNIKKAYEEADIKRWSSV